MPGFWYQIKLSMKDKMCLITFFLPLITALAVNFLRSGGFSGVENTRFAVLANEASGEIIPALERYGTVTSCTTQEQLHTVVINPIDDTIGIIPTEQGLKIVLAGDEMTWTTAVAENLNIMLLEASQMVEMTIIPRHSIIEGFLNSLIALVLVTSLFLGLTFNALNLVSEKEDGIVFINNVLPLTAQAYLIQKIAIGFIGSAVLTMLSAFILFNRLTPVLQLLPLVIFGGFAASVAGLMIGYIAENLMVSIVYIKTAMIVFMAVPMVAYLFAPPDVQPYFHILPSYTFFMGTIGILEQSSNLLLFTGILFLHSLVWFGIYRFMTGRKNL